MAGPVVEWVDGEPERRVAHPKLNVALVDDVVDALVEHPGEWARVDYFALYPSNRGVEQERLEWRVRNFARRIRQGRVAGFDRFVFEAKTDGTDLYLRAAADPGSLRRLKKEGRCDVVSDCLRVREGR